MKPGVHSGDRRRSDPRLEMSQKSPWFTSTEKHLGAVSAALHQRRKLLRTAHRVAARLASGVRAERLGYWRYGTEQRLIILRRDTEPLRLSAENRIGAVVLGAQRLPGHAD